MMRSPDEEFRPSEMFWFWKWFYIRYPSHKILHQYSVHKIAKQHTRPGTDPSARQLIIRYDVDVLKLPGAAPVKDREGEDDKKADEGVEGGEHPPRRRHHQC